VWSTLNRWHRNIFSQDLDEQNGGPFFEGTVTGAAYLNILQESIVPTVRQLYGDDTWYQQEGAPPHYHRDVRAYLDNTFPDRWIGRRGSVQCPPR